MFEATKEFNFEAGHTLDGHKGKCANLHGHNYKVFVTLKAKSLDNMDMVTDFYDLVTLAKPVFDEFDHAFMYNATAKDPFEKAIYNVCTKYGRKVKELHFRSTAENMANYFHARLNSAMPKGIWVSKVTVYETPTSFATYTEE